MCAEVYARVEITCAQDMKTITRLITNAFVHVISRRYSVEQKSSNDSIQRKRSFDGPRRRRKISISCAALARTNTNVYVFRATVAKNDHLATNGDDPDALEERARETNGGNPRRRTAREG